MFLQLVERAEAETGITVSAVEVSLSNGEEVVIHVSQLPRGEVQQRPGGAVSYCGALHSMAVAALVCSGVYISCSCSDSCKIPLYILICVLANGCARVQ